MNIQWSFFLLFVCFAGVSTRIYRSKPKEDRGHEELLATTPQAASTRIYRSKPKKDRGHEEQLATTPKATSTRIYRSKPKEDGGHEELLATTPQGMNTSYPGVLVSTTTTQQPAVDGSSKSTGELSPKKQLKAKLKEVLIETMDKLKKPFDEIPKKVLENALNEYFEKVKISDTRFDGAMTRSCEVKEEGVMCMAFKMNGHRRTLCFRVRQIVCHVLTG